MNPAMKPVPCAFCGQEMLHHCKNKLCHKPWQDSTISVSQRRRRRAEKRGAFIPGILPPASDDLEWLAHIARMQAREATLPPANDLADLDREQTCTGCGEQHWIPAPGIHCVACLAAAQRPDPTRRWGHAQEEILRTLYGRRSPRQIAEAIYRAIGMPRSAEAIKIRANRLGLDHRSNQDGLWAVKEICDHLDITKWQLYMELQRGTIVSSSSGKTKLFVRQMVDVLEARWPRIPFDRSISMREMMKRLGYAESHALRLVCSGAIRAIQRGGPHGLWHVDEAHVEEIERHLRETGATSMSWSHVPGMDKFRTQARSYSATKRKRDRKRDRQTTWMTQTEARRALGIRRDDMRLLLEMGVVRGRQENNLWLAERAHVLALARGGKRALIDAINAHLATQS